MALELLQLHRSARKKMVLDGIGRPSHNEVRLYLIIGPEEFRKVINGAFEYAYLEARFLGISNETEGFRLMCRARRNSEIVSWLGVIRIEAEKGIARKYEAIPRTSAEILKEIEAEYRSRNTSSPASS